MASTIVTNTEGPIESQELATITAYYVLLLALISKGSSLGSVIISTNSSFYLHNKNIQGIDKCRTPPSTHTYT